MPIPRFKISLPELTKILPFLLVIQNSLQTTHNHIPSPVDLGGKSNSQSLICIRWKCGKRQLKFCSSECLKKRLPTTRSPPSFIVSGVAFAHWISFPPVGYHLCCNLVLLIAIVLLLVWLRLRPRIPSLSSLWDFHFSLDVVCLPPRILAGNITHPSRAACPRLQPPLPWESLGWTRLNTREWTLSLPLSVNWIPPLSSEL